MSFSKQKLPPTAGRFVGFQLCLLIGHREAQAYYYSGCAENKFFDTSAISWWIFTKIWRIFYKNLEDFL